MKILTFLKKISWFAVLALVISALGLYFSHQNSSSDMRVSNEVPPKNDLILQGCKGQSRQYTVWMLFQKNFEFSNAGGGKASLNRVRLSDGDKREYVTNLYPTSSNFTTPVSTDSTPLALPLDIETSKTWFITGTYTYPTVDTEQAAQDEINSVLGLKTTLTWKFDFSNGQTIERDEMVDSVVPPQIDFNKSNCK